MIQITDSMKNKTISFVFHMKRIAVLLFFLVLSIPTFAEDLTGFWDAKFGDTRQSVKAMMVKRNWDISEEDFESIIYKKSGGTWVGLPVTDIKFDFANDRFNKAAVTLSTFDNSAVMDVIKVLKEKYNCKIYDTDKHDLEGHDELTITLATGNGDMIKINVINVSGNFNLYIFDFIDTEITLEYLKEKESSKRKHIEDDL